MREYAVYGANITVVNAVCSLVAIMPAAADTIEIIRCWVSQHANATSAQQRIALCTKATAFQTVTAMTPTKLKIGDPASQIVGATTIAVKTSGINASAEGAGVLTTLFEDAFNVLNGWLWVPTQNETIVMTGRVAQAFVLYFPAAPATLTGWNFGVIFRELS
jgi:hypothetical protein